MNRFTSFHKVFGLGDYFALNKVMTHDDSLNERMKSKRGNSYCSSSLNTFPNMLNYLSRTRNTWNKK